MNRATFSRDGIKRESRAGERGWALLGLILALSVMGIMLAALAPNVKFQVRRDKEAELLYRGQQMAIAISRYYNNGRPGILNIGQCRQQPRGCLTDLDKIKEPLLVGVNEIKLVRLSATIDPMDSGEWQPVRLFDPRIATYLQAYIAETNLVVPLIYEQMAGPPPPLITNPVDPNNPGGQSGQGGQTGQGGQSGQGQQGQPQQPPNPFQSYLDDDQERSNLPIIGVAPKLKGPSVRTLYGLDNYEQWIFIYIPPIAPGQNNR